jgi:AmmeMemoRadiSam system radical SAM enzyme/AmmeMemoRadiSam system protein B/AmmeMemoRadiSam system protein A
MHASQSTPPIPSTSDLPAGEYEGRWWHTVPETGRISCNLCPRNCQLKPGDRAFCFVRENRDGRMILSTYGRSTGFCIDPIEKKPLNHFFPGTSVLSFGTAGCNLGCKFCQNWDISKSREIERLSQEATPDAIARAAHELGCRSVAFTYNDPVVWAEYAIDTARACRERGIKTVAVTAGYITPEARGPFYEFMDAANVDLKAFTEDFYWHLTQSHLEPVLETLVWLKRETDVWFEITNLVIPRANDSTDELRRMSGWVLENLGDEVPVHFTAFHPDFRMTDRPATSHETLLAAYDIGRSEGLKFVYVGNVHDKPHESTYCPGCGQTLIERDWHALGAYHLRGNQCDRCAAVIPGRFDEQPGTWGPRRLPVDMRRFAGAHTKLPEGPMLPLVELRPQAAGLTLSDDQRRTLHRLACAAVVDAVLSRPASVSDDLNLASVAGVNVWGAFVTLKRQGHLRGCCGHLGQTMPATEAVRTAAARTAVEDMRLPRVSAGELEFLDLDVTLLLNLQSVPAAGEGRADAIVAGHHGLRLQRGQAAGLFLPQVAREHKWDAHTLLRELCAKAGLPTNAWKEPDAQLWTFEGLEIAAPLADGFSLAELSTAGVKFSAAEMQSLADHCRQNFAALAAGAVALYYLPGGPDGMVNGASLTLHGPEGNEIVSAAQIELVRALPLQMTAFQLVERIVAAIGRQPAEVINRCRLELAVFCDPAMHGPATSPDLRGIESSRRALLVGYRGHMSWAYEPGLEAEHLLQAALSAGHVHEPQHASVFSLETATRASRLLGGTSPRPVAGPRNRPAAVAGSFYPGDAAALSQELDRLLENTGHARQPCAAVMLPHAGYRFSGRIAAATLAQVEIPDAVIVIGPKHTPLGVDWSVAPHETWQLPGGTVRADVELAQRLAAAIPGLELDAAAHQKEHAIEVELPLVARLAPHARVVGIVMGTASLEACLDFGRRLAEVIRGLQRPPLLIISSDMNHFAPDAQTRELDALALAAFDRLDPAALFKTVRQHHISMCGLLPAVVVLECLRQLGRSKHSRQVAYATSADVTGDTSRVVGYAGAIIEG